MIDDTPKAVFALCLVALLTGRVWIAVDRSSATALRLRRWWRARWRLVLGSLAVLAFVAIAEDVVGRETGESILRADGAIAAWLRGPTVNAGPVARW